MKVCIGLLLDTELHDLSRCAAAFAAAEKTRGDVYTWKTTGRWNWLERGASVVDALGLVVLPPGLPALIDMPDDPIE